MDPISALVFAFLMTHMIFRAAAEAAADQARAEARRAAGAVWRDIETRRSETAARLAARLEAGRASGPAYPMWWAWAGMRSASALRRAWRQGRRTAEPGRPWRPTGPFTRVAGAAWRGGQYAREQARAQRQDGARRPEPVAVGVCEQCGAAVALAALADAKTRHGRKARMCARCRADTEAERRADAEAMAAGQDPGPDPAEVVDAVIVGDPPPVAPRPSPAAAGCIGCGEPLTSPGCGNPACALSSSSTSALPAEADGAGPARWQLPARSCPDCGTQLLPDSWWAVKATNADVCLFCARGYDGLPGRYADDATREREPAELAAISQPVDTEGRPVVVSRQLRERLAAEAARIALAAAAGAADDSPPDPAGPQETPAAPAAAPLALTQGDPMTCHGEIHTQADWAAQSASVTAALEDITTSSENMLRSLSAREASRSQMTAAAAWADQVAACVGAGADVIASVNSRQDPFVAAVQAAGGSEEVAQPRYYDEM